MNNEIKYDTKISNKEVIEKLATKLQKIEQNMNDDALLSKIDKILNSSNKISDTNFHDGDELMAIYSINQGKKAKDSLTYRSRMNRNLHTHYKYLEAELREHENRSNWWEMDIHPLTDE